MLPDWAGWLITLSILGIFVIIMGYGEYYGRSQDRR